MTLKGLGERNIIQMIRDIYDSDWAEDDCAYFLIGDKYMLVSTDSISAHTHIPDNVSPIQVGYFFVATTISDIAAMGGIPKYFLSSLILPPNMDLDYLKKLELGMKACLDKYHVKMLGGDLKEGKELVMSGIVLGEVDKNHILKRNTIHAGDLLCVTNTLGKNSAGYYLWKYTGSKEGTKLLIDVEPRIKEGRLIAMYGASAAMDLSDGVYASIAQLKKLTNIGFLIDFSKLPVHQMAKKVSNQLHISIEELVLNYGGEYELLFTVPPENWKRLKKMADKNDIQISVIGYAKKGENILLKEGKEYVIKKQGYEHFT